MEFLVVTPVLFLLLFGLLAIGRALSQLSWLSQTGYNIAVLGGITPNYIGAPAMTTRFNKLVPLGTMDLANNLPGGFAHTYNGTDNTISVSIGGTAPQLSGYFARALPMRTSFVAPYLLIGNNTLGNVNSFANPSEFRDCNGQPITGCGSPGCAITGTHVDFNASGGCTSAQNCPSIQLAVTNACLNPSTCVGTHCS